MRSDTADPGVRAISPAVVETAGEPAAALRALPEAVQPAAAGARRRTRPLARLRSDAARMTAVRETWRALWSSRLLVWAAGVGTVLALRLRARARRLQPARDDPRVRPPGRPAGRPRGALGRGLVPGDRPLRLPPRPRLLHVLADGFLPALSARPAGDLLAGQPAGARGRAALDGGASRSPCTGSTASPRSSWRLGAPAAGDVGRGSR